jgi:hypothetical protein
VIDPSPRAVAETDPAEEADWQALRARWDDPLAHREYLARIPDLAGLARAGARYRAVLAERPDDPVAASGRDEVVRRATLLGLAAMPREVRPARRVGRARWALLGALLVAGMAIAAWAATAFLRTGAGR